MDPALLAGLAGLAAGAVALVAALASPLHVRLGVEHDTGTRGTVRIVWLYGLLDHEVAQPPREPAAAEPEPAEPEPEEPSELPTRDEVLAKVRPLRALVETPGFLTNVRDLLAAWIGAFSFEHLRLRARFGTGNPAGTGMLYGGLQVALPPVYAVEDVQAEIQPDWDRPRLEGRVEAGFETSAAALLAPLVRFLLDPATREGLGAAWEVRPRDGT